MALASQKGSGPLLGKAMYINDIGQIDDGVHMGYTGFMDDLKQPYPPLTGTVNEPDGVSAMKRRFDGWYRTTGAKTIQTGFRIYKSQLERLKLEYEGNTSALVRFLLEKYFAGELPEIEAQFKKEMES